MAIHTVLRTTGIDTDILIPVSLCAGQKSDIFTVTRRHALCTERKKEAVKKSFIVGVANLQDDTIASKEDLRYFISILY